MHHAKPAAVSQGSERRSEGAQSSRGARRRCVVRASERPLSDAGTLARLQRALYGAYRDGCSRRIVQFDWNAGLDSRNLVAGILCHLHVLPAKKAIALPVHHVHRISASSWDKYTTVEFSIVQYNTVLRHIIMQCSSAVHVINHICNKHGIEGELPARSDPQTVQGVSLG